MKINSRTKSLLRVSACLLGLAAMPALAQPTPTFLSQNLDSDIPGIAPFTDANLIDPMGLVMGEEGQTYWVVNNSTGTMTRYGLLGKPVTLTGATSPEVITIPPASGNTVGSPTGLVIDHAAFSTAPGVAANEFLISGSTTTSVPSHLLIVTEDGEVCGFNPASAAAVGGTPSATVGVTVPGADYKGAAIAYVNTSTTSTPSYQHFLFAANFATGNIDVFNNAFQQVTLGSGTFPGTFSDADPGYAPINVKRYARIDPLTRKTLRVLLVAYAKINPSDVGEPLAGAGNGYITVFSLGAPDDATAGTKIGRLVNDTSTTNGLNVPWGMAIKYGRTQASDEVLVANNGSGQVVAYSLAGVFGPSLTAPAVNEGALQGRAGQTLDFSGLWAVHFQGPYRTVAQFAADDDELLLGIGEGNLYFSAGLLDGDHGLTGFIY
jgi:uncharacterized protein (TIGR03118 family)